jgi:phenylacetate-CoA ligase
MDFIGYQKKRIKDFFEQSVRLPVFDLSNPVLENFLGHFRTKKIYINGYTSSIVLFAKFYKTKHCFKDVCPTLKACVVTSEMLLKTTKNFEKQLNSNYQRVRRVRTRFNRNPETQKQKGGNQFRNFVC